MLLSVAACQFCLPLTQCLHKVFSPRSTSQTALFSSSTGEKFVGNGWRYSQGVQHPNPVLVGLFVICNFSYLQLFVITICLMVHFSSLALPTFVFTPWWFIPLHCMAFPLLMRIDGVPGSLWEEEPSASVSPSRMNNEWEWIRWLNCFIWILCSNAQS